MKLFESHSRRTPYIFAVFFLLLCSLLVSAQDKNKKDSGKKDKSTAPASPAAPLQDPKKLPLYLKEKVTLSDINVAIETDKRLIVMMAALNAAGYDYEPGNRELTALRQQIREDIKAVNPELLRRLRDYFLAHKKSGVTDAAAVAPYLSLALSLTEPPGFTVETQPDKLPEDVREITDFALLLEEFYRATTFSRLMPKYQAAYEKAAQSYYPLATNAAATVISYLHTEPILELPPLYVPRTVPVPAKDAEKARGRTKELLQEVAKEQSQNIQNRVRRFIIIPDLLNATNAANLRVIRDNYYLLLGPNASGADAVRRGFMRFVIDPLTDRQIKEIAAIRADLKKLLDTRGDKAERDYQESAYFLIADSLVRAVNERIDNLEKIYSRQYADEKELRVALAQTDEEAIYRLSLAYERGAVLVYHFFDQVRAFESAGASLKDYYGSMLARENVDFEKEANRLKDYEAKIASYKKMQQELASRPVMPMTISNADAQIASRLNEADEFIKAKNYADARVILTAIRRERPNNARALFGLADVTSKQAQAITDVDRLAEELYAAVELYKEAANNASPETEKWLAQRSYVAAGKILEFLGKPTDLSDAAAAFDLAIKLGEVPNGSFKEAAEAKQRLAEKIRQ
jgi:hypothetical protein